MFYGSQLRFSSKNSEQNCKSIEFLQWQSISCAKEQLFTITRGGVPMVKTTVRRGLFVLAICATSSFAAFSANASDDGTESVSKGAVRDASSSSSSATPSGEPTMTAKPDLKNEKFPDSSGLTDPKLRAEQGSLRRYSGKFNFGYMGPIIGDLSNPYQPNPDGSVTHNPTNLRGNMALRYRLSPDSALNFGTGISRIRPFGDDSRTDVSTPFVSYDISFRARAWQFRSSAQASLITNPESRNVGEVAGLSFTQSAYRNIHHTRWLAGMDISASTFVYGRGYQAGPSATPIDPDPSISRAKPIPHRHHGTAASTFAAGDGNAPTLNLNFYPTVKYRFNDNVGTYTSLAIEYYQPRSALGKLAIRDKALNQRLGLEYSITHDIYFSPYVAFYPEEISLNTTTINFSTVFSVL